MAEVTLEHVDKQYPNGVLALRDFNLTIADGEFVVLVGPSGSGKTTTLRLIAGLEDPTHGAIRIAGLDVHGVAPQKRNVAMVFQRYSLYPHLSVHDNLAFGMRLREHPGWFTRAIARFFRPARYAELRRAEEECETRVRNAARLLALEDLLQRRPEQLSGGQQQRAALGRALVRQPAVFLLDEPLSHLEPSLRAEMRRELHLLHTRLRATMVYVTHDQLEAMALGDRLVVLHHGEIQQADRPAEVYERPRNRFVAGFIGWPPMNLFDGRLERNGNGLAVEINGLTWELPAARAESVSLPCAQNVTVGLRPEHVKLVAVNAPKSVAMEVVDLEFLGSECVIALRRHIMKVATRVDARQRPAPGQTVGVEFGMQHCHLFDCASGVNLERHAPGG